MPTQPIVLGTGVLTNGAVATITEGTPSSSIVISVQSATATSVLEVDLSLPAVADPNGNSVTIDGSRNSQVQVLPTENGGFWLSVSRLIFTGTSSPDSDIIALHLDENLGLTAAPRSLFYDDRIDRVAFQTLGSDGTLLSVRPRYDEGTSSLIVTAQDGTEVLNTRVPGENPTAAEIIPYDGQTAVVVNSTGTLNDPDAPWEPSVFRPLFSVFDLATETLVAESFVDPRTPGAIIGDRSGNFISGDAGNNAISGQAGNDSILGRDGDDTIFGDDGNDNIAASGGNDSVEGGEGNDSIGGGEGSDTLQGRAGNDVIGGGPGADMIFLHEGNDVASGGAGNDMVRGHGGDDTLAGSFGNDIVIGGGGDDVMGGGSGTDYLNGSAGNDVIGAGDDDDTLDGGSGDDFLGGGAGADQLIGGDGRDTLNGGTGNDRLTGDGGSGPDTDVFVFNRFAQGEVDRVTDFQDGLDLLRLHNVAGATDAERFDALDISVVTILGQHMTQITYAGHQILLSQDPLFPGISLTEADFIFV
ncbi:MAG: calcium-binding protein [Sulfitobacter sp.]